MKRTKNGRRRFDREFKVAAVSRVVGGEKMSAVARELKIAIGVLWGWHKRYVEKGEEYLYGIGEHEPRKVGRRERGQGERIAELEGLVGRQQLEIRFLEKALCRVEEQRQPKNGNGGAASSKR